MPARGGTFGSYVVIDPVKLAELVRSPSGPVFRRLIEDAEVVKQEAQRLVGVYRPPDAYSAANRARRPGTLRDSIVKRVTTQNGMPAVLVGSDDRIALWHHEGTVPHVIRASKAPRLVFFWPRAVMFQRKAGRVGSPLVAFKQVNHPGTKPRRFLTEALQALRGRH